MCGEGACSVKPRSLTARFPTAHAREAADKAIDALPATEPMTTYLDTWIAAYRAAGGIER